MRQHALEIKGIAGDTFKDDSKLETPDMILYAQQPESEKQYDRLMAEDTLKLLIAIGYKISISREE